MAGFSGQARQRIELQRRIAAWTDVPLTVLALVMLGVLTGQLLLPLSPAWQARLNQTQTAIWAIFAADFVVELLLAPSKRRYLRRNWLIAISVVLPAFRVLRVLHAAQALRGLSLVRMLATVNRGGRALEHIARRGHFGYVLGLTVIIVVAGAGGALYFEAGQPGGQIQTPADALWWSATLVTTMNSSLSVMTLEGRVIGLLLRVYALGVSGYVTAVIAVQLFGAGQDDNSRELAALRTELEAVRRALEAQAARPTRAAPPTSTPTPMPRPRPTSAPPAPSNGAAWPAAPRR